MRDTLFRFFTIHPLNDHEIISWAMGLVWLALVLNCLASLKHRDISSRARLIWVAIVVVVPILGMAAYLLFCLVTADYSFLKFFLAPPKQRHHQSHATLKLPDMPSPKSS
ncbi:MAG: PLDc_N domain-containing protein [Verrucomicrobiaceae bacterium]|nr:PLDc_N domain-containing protein [Verrucomicrobiaceae bacterium]